MKRGLLVLCMFLLPLLAASNSATGEMLKFSLGSESGKIAKRPILPSAPKVSLGKVGATSAVDTGIRLTTSSQSPWRGPTRWSPDGKWIAFEQDGDIYIVSPLGGAPRNLTAGIDGYCYAISFTSDGASIVYTWYDGTDYNTSRVDQMEISTGTVANIVQSYVCGVWSHNGQYFAARDLGGRLVVYDSNTNQANVIDNGDAIYEYLCFSADDTAIITTMLDITDTLTPYKLFAIAPGGGTPVQLTRHAGMHQYPDCSPDGKWILYTSATDQTEELYALEISTLTSKPVFPSDSGLFYWGGSFSPNSQRFSYLNWDAATQCFEVYAAPFPLASGPVLRVTSPNGGEVWTAGYSQTITWTATGVSSANLYYSTDNGATWTSIATNIDAAKGQYTWAVPSTLSGSFLIRVSSSSDNSIGDKSDAAFTINKQQEKLLTLIAPNGGEKVVAGTPFNITWASTGITELYLEYSTDNGATWIMIEGGVNANNSSYSWTPPAVASVKCLIRISDSNDMSTRDVSSGTFEIAVPSLTVLSPNGGEVWVQGSSQSITWDCAGVDNVVLEYSADGGANWTVIETKLAAGGETYTWKVPAVNSQKCFIRIKDSASFSRYDVSDAAFTITPVVTASVKVTSPNGGERWVAGSSHNIIWTSSGISTVNIDFSSDNGSTWSSVATNVSSDTGNGSYLFTLPEVISRECRVRVVEINNAAGDWSDAVFTVVPAPFVKVLNPAGGESWTSGETRNIVFRCSDVARVNLEYSTDNGANWLSIDSGVEVTGLTLVSAADALAPEYSFSWTLPSVAASSDRCTVRVTSAGNSLIRDRSAAFAIAPAAPSESVTLLYPSGGETFHAGDVITIRWEAQGLTKVNIGFTTDTTGETYNSLVGTNIDASLGEIQWTVPYDITTTGRIIIVKTGADSPYDYSRTYFAIDASTFITLAAPNGGEVLHPGDSCTIRWQSSGMGEILIIYSTDDWATSSAITSTDASLGSYEWTVPYVNSSTVQIAIGDAYYFDYSDGYFTISPSAKPYVQLTAPNGGEVWTAGTSQTIRWSSQNSTNVKLEYSTDTGANWKTVIASTPAASGTYSWNVPNEISSNCLVRITDASDVSATDVSDAVFSIVSSNTAFITVKSPQEGDQWAMGSTQVIKWDFRGLSGVKIEFSKDGGETWTELVVNPSTAANGTWSWTVPETASANCLIRVSDTGNASVSGVSGKFEIVKPGLVIAHTPITEAKETDVLTFTANVTGTSSPIVELVYDVTGKRKFQTRIPMKKSGENTWSCSLAQGTFTAQGIEYVIMARDSVNVGLRAAVPETGFYCITSRVTDMISTYTVAGGSVQNAYRLVSIPLNLDETSIAGQFTYQPKGEMGPDWRFFRFSPGDADPHEYPGIEGFAPGNSFWLITRNDFTVHAPAGRTVTTAEPYTLTLKPGWNDISNPWMFDISWRDIENPSNANLSVPYSYEGSWSDPTVSSPVLKPWRGYAVKNLENRNVIIRLTPKPASSTGKLAKAADAGQWELTLSAVAGLAADRSNHLGVRSDAFSDWDSTDHVEPPVIGEYVSLSFPHRDWVNHPSAYTVDFRSPDSPMAWNFDVQTNISGEMVTVSLDGLSSLPSGAAVEITDRDTGRAMTLAGNSFRFSSGAGGIERHFTLTVRTAGAQDDPGGKARPTEFLAVQAYPNPFNPSTVIRYELSRSSRVLITVFNTVGQKVREYDLGRQDRGAHEMIFDARGLTSGTYMYRVNAGYASEQGKMMFMK